MKLTIPNGNSGTNTAPSSRPRAPRPTPETRRLGRGKAKTFSESETVIAFVVEKLMRRGLRAAALASVADWLRSHTGGDYWRRAAEQQEPVYLRFAIDPPDGWTAEMELARSLNNSDELFLSVRQPNSSDPKSRAADLTVLDLSDAIRRVQHNATEVPARGGLLRSSVEAG